MRSKNTMIRITSFAVLIHFAHHQYFTCAGVSVEQKQTEFGNECVNNTVPLRLELKNFNNTNPYQILWTVVDTNDTTTQFFGSFPVDDGDKSDGLEKYYNKTFCVQSTRCLRFTIYDSSTDKLCCQQNNGSFRLYYNHNPVKYGGNFKNLDSSTSFGDGCTTTNLSNIIKPTANSPFTNPKVQFPSNSSTIIYAQSLSDSLSPTIVPKASVSSIIRPSLSLIPMITPKPSKFCVDFVLEITPDTLNQNRWEVKDISNGSILLNGQPERLGTSIYSFCIPLTGCYKFTIYDTQSNGFIDFGYYKVFFNDVLVIQGKNFAQSQSSDPFGLGCEYKKSFSPSTRPSWLSQSSVLINNTTPNPSIMQTFSNKGVLQSAMHKEKEILDFYVDRDKKRHFPKPIWHETIAPFPLVPKCASGNLTSSVGCLSFPKRALGSIPKWSGDIRNIPPTCNILQNRSNELLCTAGFPKNQYVLPLQLKPVQQNAFSSAYEPIKLPVKIDVVLFSDVNDDGSLDLILGCVGCANKLAINDGNGNFDNITDLPGSEDITTSLSIGDVDGNGAIDIVVGKKSGFNELLLNDGRGIFLEPIILPGGSHDTTVLMLGDINNDGFLDITIGNRFHKNQIIFNDGNGGFSEPIELPGGNADTRAVAVGDVTGDSFLDIVIGNESDNNILLVNNGNGMFSSVVYLPGGFLQNRGLALGDVNGDNALDIVIINRLEVNQLLLNDGNGLFTSLLDLPGGYLDTTGVSLGDINGDGVVDIVVTNWGALDQVILNNWNSETGNFVDVPIFETVITFGEAEGSMSVALGDVNGDGALDTVVGQDDCERVAIRLYLNIGSGTVKSAHNIPGNVFNTYTVAVGDLNNDSTFDIVFGNANGPNQILFNTGSAQYWDTSDLPGETQDTRTIVLGDLDNDGYLDIVIGNLYQPNQIIFNDKKGNFGLIIELPGGSFGTSEISLGDVNGDGFLDLAIANMYASNFIITNDGNGMFSSAIPLPGGSTSNSRAIKFGDINGDNTLDIVIGNFKYPNQLLLNDRNGEFRTIADLPGGQRDTNGIGLGDMNGNGVLDIFVGNWDTDCQILINNGDGTFIAQDLPIEGRTFPLAKSVAIGDLDGDGRLDIVLSTYKNVENILLLNDGTGNFSFSTRHLPGAKSEARGAALGDMNNDGLVDIVFGTIRDSNQILFYEMCPNGGAQIHSKSLCFHCPAFMGRQVMSDVELSQCVECMPDFLQSKISERCSMNSCFLEERPLGQNVCTKCNNGTFYNTTVERNDKEPSTWQVPRCLDCKKGEYSDRSIPAVDGCFKCDPGTHQPQNGQDICLPCRPGSFQPDRGQAECDLCAPGGYCNAIDTCGGGFSSCLPGTYNPYKGQNNKTACIDCPVGTFSTKSGANTSDFCELCPKGTFTNKTGQSRCEPCPLGTYQMNAGQTSCIACKEGSYANKTGLVECTPCPYRLSSFRGSTTCSFCAESFYLYNLSIRSTDLLFKKPDEYCLDCPPNAECPPNTTLQTLGVPNNFWRDSVDTSKLYPCNNLVCQGLRAFEINVESNHEDSENMYCTEGHTGALCEVCISEQQYFNEVTGRCEDCPSLIRLVTIAVLFVVLGLLLALAHMTFIYYPGLHRKVIGEVTTLVSTLSIQAKFKTVISFYQVIQSLRDVYGVELDERFKSWLNFVEYLNFGLIENVGVPTSCLGSMKVQLLINGLWPYFFITVGLLCIYCYTWLKYKINASQTNNNFRKDVWSSSVYFVIIVMFLVLPSVSGSIFEAIKCTSFLTDDYSGTRRSYLVANLQTECNSSEDNDYKSINQVFWVFFFLWPVLVPVSFACLLWYISDSVRSQRITDLTNACQFLWRDYNENYMFWEVIDILRKVFLTGLIMLIDRDEGSSKIFRLLLAIAVSTIYVGIMALARPFRRTDDLYLAFITNVLLTCCFVLGIILQHCKDDDDAFEDCDRLIGYSLDSSKASLVTVIVTVTVLIISIMFLIMLAFQTISAPVVRLIGSGCKPNLEMSSKYNFHVFFSHVWSTGKDKTHAAVRKLQLLVPGIKVWLDVDELHEVTQLEESVNESCVVVIFYTDGYFKSKNCQREARAAVEAKKTVVLLYEGGPDTIDRIRRECLDNWSGLPGADSILKHIFREDPILWLGNQSQPFAIESIKLLSLSIFRCLKYYQSKPAELQAGVKVKGELKKVDFKRDFKILVCKENPGSIQVAEELQKVVGKNLVSVREVDDMQIDYFEWTTDTVANTFFLLYLNDRVFSDEDGALYKTLKMVLDNNVKIVLVHEQEVRLGAVPFDTFFNITPQELLEPPYTLYKDIAVPLYSIKEYRKVSLLLLLSKMNGKLILS